MSKPAATIDEIKERQASIKALMQQYSVIADYSYNKGELADVKRFLESILKRDIKLPKNKVLQLLYLKQYKAERYYLQSASIQLVRLFYRLQNRYFSQLQTNHLPTALAFKVEQVLHFIARFNTDSYEHKIIENVFGLLDVIKLMVDAQQQVTWQDGADFWKALFEIEVYFSLVKATKKYGFVFPELGATQLAIEAFYHPLLPAPVKNTIALTDANTLLVTGPNMSGKSTLLKAISICIYLAHTGMSVPAQSCSIPYFKHFMIAINAKDNLEQGYSHFMHEVLNLKEALLAAGTAPCFAVFDELFKGTNVEDALAISQTTLDGLAQFPNAVFVVSTHLHALQQTIKEQGKMVCHLDCVLEADKQPKFTYQLRTGWSVLKIGQVLFAQAGLNQLLSAK